LLVWAIGVLSKSAGFTIPFLLLGALGLLGFLPLLPVSWDAPSSQRNPAQQG